tara:strand:- start:4570 stop:5022 length:453 start_codon:yes stop_codon:yes gene_type:complete
MSTFQKKLQLDRSNERTSNAGLKWDPEDDKYLLTNAKNGVDISEIALNLKRTEGSIKTRIIINVLQILGSDRSKLADLCKEYYITEDDVTGYESKKEQRETRRVKPSYNDKRSSYPANDTAEIFEGLSHLNRKMDSLLDKMNELSRKVSK